MSFIRVKKRVLDGDDIYYAYLVKNKWDRKLKSPRQSVSKYLGRVFYPIKGELSFEEFIGKDLKEYALLNSRNRIISDLVRWEIKRHNFEARFVSYGLYIEDKEIVLAINEGYLCKYTIGKLLRFKPKSDDPHLVGLELATAFTNAGISIPKELFVLIYDKFGGTIY